MLGHALVDERVVGRQQFEHAAILAHQAFEEELGLAAERLAKRVVVIGVKERVGQDLVDILQAQPLRGKARRERLGARSRAASGAAAVRARPEARSARSAARARSSLSGDVPHRKNDRREASSESPMR